MIIARKYLYLIALAREKHFGHAASASNVSPSTLSAAIHDIETELGVAVVERGQQFTGLTQEGRCIVEYVQRMAATAEGLRQELSKLRDGLTGRLHLGVIPTALTVVGSLTAAFSRRHPQVRIEVLSLSTDEIFSRLERFELDAGVVYVESGLNNHLLTIPLWRENHVLLYPNGQAEFEGRNGVTWREASQIPLCLLTQDMQNRKTIDAVFAQLECKVIPSLETNSIISMLAHVCSGAWSAILPRSVLDLIGVPTGVQVLPLTEPAVEWATGLVVAEREPRPPMIEALLEEARGLNTLFGKSE
jgi:DNA-binding transcriptional LysR family regulator